MSCKMIWFILSRCNPNLPEGVGRNGLPYILFYNFLLTSPNFILGIVYIFCWNHEYIRDNINRRIWLQKV